MRHGARCTLTLAGLAAQAASQGARCTLAGLEGASAYARRDAGRPARQVPPLVALPAERAGRVLALLNARMPPAGLDPDLVAYLSDANPDGAQPPT